MTSINPTITYNGAYFGMFIDKFEILWLVNYISTKSKNLKKRKDVYELSKLQYAVEKKSLRWRNKQ